MRLPFDGVLVIAFGGPRGPADVRPFLANVLRGRAVPPQRVDEVAAHYDLFGGVSPITEQTARQADGLQTRLARAGLPLPVFVGMRNWHPYLPDTLRAMAVAGVQRAVGLILSPYRSYSSCEQYRQNVVEARRTVAASGEMPPDVVYVGDWHDHPGLIAANVAHLRSAIDRLPAESREGGHVIFTAHSIPASMAVTARYEAQLRDTSARVASAAGVADWVLVYQSRSGRPSDPWLEPDILDYLRQLRASGRRAVVISPIGFMSDHVEVLYDLDHEAAVLCRELGLDMVRASAVNDHPAFLDGLAGVVLATIHRYNRGRPLAVSRSVRL